MENRSLPTNDFLLSFQECLEAVDGRVLSYLPEETPWGISIDSRTIQPGELFLAVSGDRFDGHDFIEPALQAGACGAIVSHPRPYPADKVFIEVNNVRQALLRLAAACRRKWGGRLVGVTGSAGKTTTKELIAALFSPSGAVHLSQGNFNNEIGLSLSLLGLRAGQQRAVVEIGMNHPGEIAALAAVAAPDIGVLTCVAPVHLEFFASLEEIADAKAELIPFLSSDGRLVFNADDPLLAARVGRYRGTKLSFGLTAQAGIRAVNIHRQGLLGSSFEVCRGEEVYPIHTTLPGIHNIYNLLAAIATAVAEGLPFESIVHTHRKEPSLKHRGAVLPFTDGFTVIDDSYNSNPRAFTSMLDLLKDTAGFQRKLIVAGEMRELGFSSGDWHRQCGRMTVLADVDLLIGVQGDARYLLEGAKDAGLPPSKMVWADSAEEALTQLKKQLRRGDLVLIKGSRGVGLDRVVDALQAEFSLMAQESNSKPGRSAC